MKKTNNKLKSIVRDSSLLFVAAVVFFLNGQSLKSHDKKEENTQYFQQYYIDQENKELDISISIVDHSYSSNSTEDDIIDYPLNSEQINNDVNNPVKMEPEFTQINLDAISNDLNEPEHQDDKILLHENTDVLDLTYLENIANYYNEELVYNTNPDYIEEVQKFLRNPKDTQISKDYMYVYVTNLFELSDKNIFTIYRFIESLSEEHSYLSTEALLYNFLNVVFYHKELDESFELYKEYNNLTEEQAQNIVLDFRDNYLNGNSSKLMNDMMFALFHKLFANIPEEFKINCILKEQDITEDEFDVITSMTLCEALPGSNLDAWFVAGAVLNRSHSIRWVNYVEKYYEGKGENIFYQMITPGQFEVYKRGQYLCYYGKDKHYLNNYEAVIDAYFRPEYTLSWCLSFLGNAYSGNEDKIQPGIRTNNFWRYQEIDDRIPFEQRDNYYISKSDINDISRTRK